jgi:CO dehydrogenase nickel-insertion accessory protein CooC1
VERITAGAVTRVGPAAAITDESIKTLVNANRDEQLSEQMETIKKWFLALRNRVRNNAMNLPIY